MVSWGCTGTGLLGVAVHGLDLREALLCAATALMFFVGGLAGAGIEPKIMPQEPLGFPHMWPKHGK